MDNRQDKYPAIFESERFAHRMSFDQLRWVIKRISGRPRINKGIHPDELRHSYATHLLNNGAPIEII
ncbi:tyrosine-type recombinase/integrase [Peribacillus saganii]|uniref:tyrosine-type recombinase/integrase n=1 Tax=Peribacillus saganii TaxID=2303992 RepID=UPI002278B01F|nr:tyrosine-type recombinase/integrase [Peribacillus saganii]